MRGIRCLPGGLYGAGEKQWDRDAAERKELGARQGDEAGEGRAAGATLESHIGGHFPAAHPPTCFVSQDRSFLIHQMGKSLRNRRWGGGWGEWGWNQRPRVLLLPLPGAGWSVML